ncbi:MAG: sigma-70 family RNA polymerase sigma factor [Acidimicrobiia bacterium]
MTRTPELTGFCREAWPRLVGALSLYTGDRHVAEELSQEALVRVCERWTEVRAMESPMGWAHRVGFNLASSHYRRRGAERRARQRLGAVVDVTAPPVEAADALALRNAVAALPESQRRALVLRYYVDLPVADVALLMDCPENTVKTHTRRAIESLRGAGLTTDDELRTESKEMHGGE